MASEIIFQDTIEEVIRKPRYGPKSNFMFLVLSYQKHKWTASLYEQDSDALFHVKISEDSDSHLHVAISKCFGLKEDGDKSLVSFTGVSKEVWMELQTFTSFSFQFRCNPQKDCLFVFNVNDMTKQENTLVSSYLCVTLMQGILLAIDDLHDSHTPYARWTRECVTKKSEALRLLETFVSERKFDDDEFQIQIIAPSGKLFIFRSKDLKGFEKRRHAFTINDESVLDEYILWLQVYFELDRNLCEYNQKEKIQQAQKVIGLHWNAFEPINSLIFTLYIESERHPPSSISTLETYHYSEHNGVIYPSRVSPSLSVARTNLELYILDLVQMDHILAKTHFLMMQRLKIHNPDISGESHNSYLQSAIDYVQPEIDVSISSIPTPCYANDVIASKQGNIVGRLSVDSLDKCGFYLPLQMDSDHFLKPEVEAKTLGVQLVPCEAFEQSSKDEQLFILDKMFSLLKTTTKASVLVFQIQCVKLKELFMQFKNHKKNIHSILFYHQPINGYSNDYVTNYCWFNVNSCFVEKKSK
jgi:hypothetical protein